MAGRNANISVKIEGEADFAQARREAKTAIADIEKNSTVELSAELDTAEIRKAIALAEQLDGMVASFTVDTDAGELVAAEQLAKSLRSFQGRVNLSVEGQGELRDALGLAEKMDQLRKVRVEVLGRQDLERAAEIADDLERKRTVRVDVDDSDLAGAGDTLARGLAAGGEEGASGVAGALGGIDFENIGSSGAEQLTGALAAAGPWGALAAGVGAVFGESLLEGFNNALPDARGDTIRALKANLSESDLAAVGEAGGAAYSSGLAEGLSGAKDTAAALQGQLGRIDEAFDLTEVTRQATALEQVFGVDMTEAINAVAKLVSQGLVADSREGFDLLFELGQQTQGQFDEMLTSTDEFSTSIKALGIEGPRGLKLIGEMIRTGIFEQADQAGEVFSELNETIVNGGAADALQELTGNAEGFTAAVAGGGPEAAAAVSEIATQLLAVDDNAKQAQLTTAIFGGNMGLLGDDAREAALQLFATADGIDIVGTGASDAADRIEDSASGLDRLKKAAVEAAEQMAGPLADGLAVFDALQDGDWTKAIDGIEGVGKALAEQLLGPLALIPGDPFGPLVDGFDRLTGKADDLPPKLGATIDKMGETGDASEEMADGLDTATESADALEAQLRGLFDFDADQLMRDVAGAADDLADSLKEGGLKALDMSGGIDISTESGRRLQDQMEGLTDILIDARVAAANKKITAEELADAEAFLAGEFDRVTGAAGLTKDQVEALRQKYLQVPDEVNTTLNANTAGAISNVAALQQAIANIKSKSVTISASINGPVGISASGTIARKARGGWTDGLTLVGEEGPELIDVRGRAFVHTAAETRSIMSNRGGDLGGGAPSPLPAAGRGPQVYIDKWVVDKGRDSWQDLLLAQQVYATL